MPYVGYHTFWQGSRFLPGSSFLIDKCLDVAVDAGQRTGVALANSLKSNGVRIAGLDLDDENIPRFEAARLRDRLDIAPETMIWGDTLPADEDAQRPPPFLRVQSPSRRERSEAAKWQAAADDPEFRADMDAIAHDLDDLPT